MSTQTLQTPVCIAVRKIDKHFTHVAQCVSFSCEYTQFSKLDAIMIYKSGAAIILYKNASVMKYLKRPIFDKLKYIAFQHAQYSDINGSISVI